MKGGKGSKGNKIPVIREISHGDVMHSEATIIISNVLHI